MEEIEIKFDESEAPKRRPLRHWQKQGSGFIKSNCKRQKPKQKGNPSEDILIEYK